MAQAAAYERQKNFADDFGNETDHSALNAELDRASNSINDIRANLAILQADDGKLRPSVLTADSVSGELKTVLMEMAMAKVQVMLDEAKAAAQEARECAGAAAASAEQAREVAAEVLRAASGTGEAA